MIWLDDDRVKDVLPQGWRGYLQMGVAGVVYLPTPVVIKAPGEALVPDMARIYNTEMFYHEGEILRGDHLQEKLGDDFHGTNHFEPMYLVEVWRDMDVPSIQYMLRGWIVIGAGALGEVYPPDQFVWGPGEAKDQFEKWGPVTTSRPTGSDLRAAHELSIVKGLVGLIFADHHMPSADPDFGGLSAPRDEGGVRVLSLPGDGDGWGAVLRLAPEWLRPILWLARAGECSFVQFSPDGDDWSDERVQKWVWDE